MSMDEGDLTPHLVSNCTFDRKEYLIKMYAQENLLKLCIIDNTTSEKWVCTYNALYIEELTRKTGNYKKFSIFITMLTTGILRTNNCVKIDLMSHTDLEALSERKRFNQKHYYKTTNSQNSDNIDTRKYLILIYTVEFDKIHYPLPLEYCGMPNPRILQKRINVLEKEKQRLEQELAQNECNKCAKEIPILQSQIMKLIDEKKLLQEEIKRLTIELGDKLFYNINQQNTFEPTNQERLKLFDKINKLKEENTELFKTIEIMTKKLNNQPGINKSNNKFQICSNCRLQKTKPLNLNTKFNSPRTSIDSNKKKLHRTTSKSSVTSTGCATFGSNKSVVKRKRRPAGGFRKINKTASDGDYSSTESHLSKNSNYPRFHNNTTILKNLPATIITNESLIKQHELQSCKTTTSRNYFQQETQVVSNKCNNSNTNLTTEQLRKQINELVSVVQSWSYNFCNNLQLNEKN